MIDATWFRLRPVLTLLACGCASSCTVGDAPASSTAARDTLPNGVIRVSHGSLSTSPPSEIHFDLQIGTLDGEPYEVFGDVRGIEATTDGTIYILDYQASEIRAFAPDGSYLRLHARRGEGPGELTEANGMILADDGTLWVQDHAK